MQLTPTEVYNKIVSAVLLSTMLKHMTPDSDMTTDKATRLANIEAVKHTWYYFNNQVEFLNLPMIKFYEPKDN